jgi:hypothetical protein
LGESARNAVPESRLADDPGMFWGDAAFNIFFEIPGRKSTFGRVEFIAPVLYDMQLFVLNYFFPSNITGIHGCLYY